MATLNELYELVHSLDRTEKRYLKQFVKAAAGKSKERYEENIDIITSQPTFDKEKLKQLLTATKGSTNLSELNTNLHSFICKALAIYHAESMPNLSFQKELMVIETLMLKGLFKQALHKLERLYTQVEEVGGYYIMHRLLELKTSLLIHTRDEMKINETSEQRIEQRLKIQDIHRNYIEYMRLYGQYNDLKATIGQPRTEAHLEHFKELLRHPLLQSKDMAMSPRALDMYYFVKTDAMSVFTNHTEQYELMVEGISMSRKYFTEKGLPNPEFFMHDRCIGLSIDLRSPEKFEMHYEAIGRLRLMMKDKGVSLIATCKLTYSRLMYYMMMEDYDAGCKYYEGLDRDMLDELDKQVTVSYLNHILAARNYNLAGEYDKSLECLSKVDKKEALLRPAIKLSKQFLYLINHYKLNNQLYLPYAVKSVYRSLRGMDSLYEPEKAMLTFLSKSRDKHQTEVAMLELYEKYKVLKDDPLNRGFFALGDYMEWLEREVGR